MKVVCIENKYEDGVFFKETKKVNLTIGKTYEVRIVTFGSLGQYVDITGENIQFLVYDDVNEWQIYRKEFFKPCE